MKWLLRLYPPTWRNRYEDEFTAMIEQRGLSMSDTLNIVFMAAQSHLSMRQRPRHGRARGTVALGILCVSLCFSVALIALSSFQGPAVQASPAVIAKSIVYHHVNGHWLQTHTVRGGESVRFTFSFRQYGMSFTPLHVNWYLQHGRFSPTGSHPYGRVVWQGRLSTMQRSRQSADFSTELTIPKTLTGQFYLQFSCYGVDPPQQMGKVVAALGHSAERLMISET